MNNPIVFFAGKRFQYFSITWLLFSVCLCRNVSKLQRTEEETVLYWRGGTLLKHGIIGSMGLEKCSTKNLRNGEEMQIYGCVVQCKKALNRVVVPYVDELN
ncbi:hypothetical protein QTP88_013155 [Uroleucon formosanum]